MATRYSSRSPSRASNSGSRYSDYSNSFDSEEEISNKKPQAGKTRYGNASKPPPGRTINKAPPKHKPGQKGPPFQSQTVNKTQVKQRVMSARRLKVNELQNVLEDQNIRLRDMEEENKILRRLQQRQERALEKFEDRESDLPQLMRRHASEVHALREQNRRVKEKSERTARTLRDTDDEMEKMKKKMLHYKELCEDRQLMERDELSRRFILSQNDNQDKDRRIQELERHLENIQKNHKHQLGIEYARQRELQMRLDSLHENYSNAQTVLKEKEKELDIRNIYSNRISRPPHRLPASYAGTPHESPKPSSRRKKRTSSGPEMTPRDKALMYEAKRKEEELAKRKLFTNLLDGSDHVDSPDLFLEEARHEVFLRTEREAAEIEASNEVIQQSIKPIIPDIPKQKDRENAERKKREEEARRQEEEDSYMKVEREHLKRESEIREEKEKKKRHEERLRSEEERAENERLEQERFEKNKAMKEREKKERLEEERAEADRLADEERKRFQNDPLLQEAERKKQLLLEKLKEIDAGSRDEADLNPFIMPSSMTNENTDQQDGSSGAYVQVFGMTNNELSHSGESTPTSKKSYNFTKAIENLHQGKPSHEDISVPYIDRQKRRQSKDIFGEDGSYQPSFESNKNTINISSFEDSGGNIQDKKANLMDELFGKNLQTNTSDTDDIFSFSTNTKPNVTSNKAFPWDDSAKPIIQVNQKSSALFAGGSALIDDGDTITPTVQLLPRRQRHHQNSFSTKPAISAVDHYDDEIEEVIL